MSKSKKAQVSGQPLKTARSPLNKEIIISAGIIIILTLIVFAPAFNNTFLLWDDDQLVVDNPAVKTLSAENIKQIFTSANLGSYNPLVILVFSIERSVFGFNAGAFHTINIVLHILNSLLVFWLIFLLSKNNMISLFTALLFSVHPMHSEAVLWISAMKDTLSTLFFLASIISYISYLKEPRRTVIYLVSLASFVLAVLSKPAAVTLPVVLVIVYYYTTGRPDRGAIKQLIPYFVVSLAFAAVTFFTFGISNVLGAAYSTVDSIFIFFYSLLFYFYRLFVPLQLAPAYPLPVKQGNWLPVVYLASPVVILFIVAALFKWGRKYKEILFASLFFLVTILPVSNIIPLKNSSLVFDRFTYVPYIGLFFLISTILYYYFTKVSRDMKNVAAAFAFAAILVLSYLTNQRAGVWKNDITLWSDAVEKYPEFALGYANLAEAYYKGGDPVKSINSYNSAIRLDSNTERYYNDRGNIYRDQKDYTKAAGDYRHALDINPANVIVLNNLGILLSYEKKFDEALSAYNKAIELSPSYSRAYMNKGNLYIEMRKYDSALIALNKAAELEPLSVSILQLRAVVYTKKEDYNSAVTDLKKAISLDPEQEVSYQKLAYTYFTAKDFNSAWELISEMKKRKFRIDPKFIEMLESASGRKSLNF